MEEEVHYRISKIMAILLILLALSIDVAELVLEWLGIGILGLSTLLSVCATVAFWVWFKILEVPFIASPKKFFTLALTCLAEIIPGLDAIGGFFWTAGTIILVLMVRAEDKGGVVGKISSAASSVAAARYSANKSQINRISNLNREQLRQEARLLRPKMNISKQELAKEASGSDNNRDLELYGQAINRLGYAADKNLDKLKSSNNVLNLKENNKQGGARE